MLLSFVYRLLLTWFDLLVASGYKPVVDGVGVPVVNRCFVIAL